MRNPSEAWQRRFRSWVVPLVLCIVNVIGVGAYYLHFSGNVEALADVKESASNELAELEGERRTAEAFLERADERRQMLKSLYDDHFDTEADRLTDMIREAKRLARQAGLQPKTVSYPEKDLAEGELLQKRMVFPVQGTYEQLRMFMNFLELTDQFLTLEGITLDGNVDVAGREPVLGVTLELSTIFVIKESPDSSGDRS